MRNRWASVLILVMLMVALAIPASASYSAADVVNYYMQAAEEWMNW